MNLLALDSRWQRLNDPNYACKCCGRSFGGIVDMGFGQPDCWPHGPLTDGDTLTVGDDVLTADLCVFDDLRFVHCVVPLPVRGSDEVFLFGAWASLAVEDFKAYVLDATGEQTGFAGAAAWLMNDLPLFESDDPIACTLKPAESGAERPHLTAVSGPLAQAQAEGISFDQLLEIYAACGEDLRPHLMG